MIDFDVDAAVIIALDVLSDALWQGARLLTKADDKVVATRNQLAERLNHREWQKYREST